MEPESASPCRCIAPPWEEHGGAPVKSAPVQKAGRWILKIHRHAGALTDLGRNMVEFPLDPPLSKMLLVGAQLGCAAEVLTVVSMLSVPGVFFRPPDRYAGTFPIPLPPLELQA